MLTLADAKALALALATGWVDEVEGLPVAVMSGSSVMDAELSAGAENRTSELAVSLKGSAQSEAGHSHTHMGATETTLADPDVASGSAARFHSGVVWEAGLKTEILGASVSRLPISPSLGNERITGLALTKTDSENERTARKEKAVDTMVIDGRVETVLEEDETAPNDCGLVVPYTATAALRVSPVC